MKKFFSICVMLFILAFQQTADAKDVYACNYEGHEIWVDSNSVNGSRVGGQMMVHKIKFVKNNKTAHSAMGTFMRDSTYGIWMGNIILIDGMPTGTYHIPVESDVLLLGIFRAAYTYLP